MHARYYVKKRESWSVNYNTIVYTKLTEKENKRRGEKRVVGGGDDLIQLFNVFGLESAPSRRAQRILKDLNETASSFHITRHSLAFFGGVSNKPCLLFSLSSRARAASRVCMSSNCFCRASLRSIFWKLDKGFVFSVSGAPYTCSSVLLLELLSCWVVLMM